MKNFINSLFLLVSFTIITVEPAHSTPPMRDMSLSVEETNRQLATPQTPRNNIADPGFDNDSGMNNDSGFDNDSGYSNNIGYGNNSGYGNNNGFDADVPIDPNMARQMNDLNTRNNTQNNNIIGNGINVGASRIPPPIRGQNQQGFINKFCSSGYTSKTNSTEAQKACMDIQRQEACERFVKSSVNVQRLLSQAIDCEASSANGYIKSGCDGLDASRLDLLKQYWQDEDISYTILFLPDMVLNSAANCAASTRHGTIR